LSAYSWPLRCLALAAATAANSSSGSDSSNINGGDQSRPSSPTGWTDTQRNLFLQNYAVQAVQRGASVYKAASICDCTLAQIETRYSPAEAVSLSDTQLAAIGAQCS
jgi:hypothetical protein